jgi:hypothetical protein
MPKFKITAKFHVYQKLHINHYTKIPEKNLFFIHLVLSPTKQFSFFATKTNPKSQKLKTTKKQKSQPTKTDSKNSQGSDFLTRRKQ